MRKNKKTLSMLKSHYKERLRLSMKQDEGYEGYSDVSYEDVWNLNNRLANIISKHLHAFLKAVKGSNGVFPTILDKGNSDAAYKPGYRLSAI